MKAFHSAREAKEFLISKIVAEARLENVALSEVERKMLYFSETGWTLPDIMEINDAFDREYDMGKYERRIAKLIKKADKRVRKASAEEYESWWSAIRFLRREDHYILVMIQMADLRPAGDQWRLFLSALGIVTCFLFVTFLSAKYNIGISKHFPSRDAIWFFAWLLGLCFAVAYFLFGFLIGTKKRDDIVSKGLEAFARIYGRVR